MTDLKRLPVKYIRDYIKKDYKLRDCCYICDSTNLLELHHLYSVSELFTQWCIKNNVKNISTEQQMFAIRVKFAEECSTELDNSNLYTLCADHHKRLHNLYGQTYPNFMAPKIKNWIQIQKDKHGN